MKVPFTEYSFRFSVFGFRFSVFGVRSSEFGVRGSGFGDSSEREYRVQGIVRSAGGVRGDTHEVGTRSGFPISDFGRQCSEVQDTTAGGQRSPGSPHAGALLLERIENRT